VIHLTRSVALELGECGIRVNCICPGIIATPLAAGRTDVSDEQLQKLKGALAHTQALGRIGDPEDIALAALWLASDDSSFVTGHAQVVDGGAFAGRPWSKQADWITQPRPMMRLWGLGTGLSGAAPCLVGRGGVRPVRAVRSTRSRCQRGFASWPKAGEEYPSQVRTLSV
jgi:hypothetical protein